MNNKGTAQIEFSIITPSRHPQPCDGYDKVTHAYRSDYVRPQSWRLDLEIGITPAPEEIDSHRWTVRQIDGEFEYSVDHHEEASGIDDISVNVPEQGEYAVTLQVGLTNGRTITRERRFHLRDFLVVSIGDSYFCGEGNPDVPGVPNRITGPITCNLATFTKFLIEKTPLHIPMEREAEWQEKRAHRSYQSGPSLAAKDLQLPALGSVVTFLNFARSGSTIDEGLLGPRPIDEGWTDLGQVEEAKQTVGDRPIDALIISIGGNDIQFSERLVDLLRDDLMIIGTGGGMGDDEQNRREEKAEAKESLAKLPDRLDRLAEAVKVLNPRHIYLMEYPTGHFETVDEEGEVVVSSGCGIFEGPDMDIDGKDAQVIKNSAEKLNEVLRRATERHSWIFVDGVADSFAGHGRCSADPYFVSAEESCKIQGDFEGTMHPNKKGHEAYGSCIQKALSQYTIAPGLATRSPSDDR